MQYPLTIPAPTPIATNTTATMNTVNSLAPRRDPLRRKQRMEFALLIKILLKSLSDAGESNLCQQVRSSISTCTKRNKLGDPSFAPLEDILEAHLWMTVGDVHWKRANDLRRIYLQKRQQQRRQPRLMNPMMAQVNPHNMVVPL